MALTTSKILNCHSLANGFQHITLENTCYQDAQPGHYVIIEESLKCYVMKHHNNQIECIILPTTHKYVKNETVLSSPLMGKPIHAPLPTLFYLLICNLQTLPGCLFYLKQHKKVFHGLVLIEANGPLPFFPSPSRQIIPNLPSDVIASLPLLEDWGISNRLTNTVDMPGCFHGTAQELITLMERSDSKLQYHRLNF